MKKLDESKVRYIVREKRKGTKNAIIAEQMEAYQSAGFRNYTHDTNTQNQVS